MHTGPQSIRVGILTQRILPHFRHLGLVLLLRDERAELRAAQVGSGAPVIQAKPNLAPHIGRGLEAQRANEAQVDVDDVAGIFGIEVEKEVLAKGFGEGEAGGVDKRCFRSKPALGAADGEWCAAEVGVECPSKAVNDMSLRHVSKSTRRPCCCRLSGYYPLNGRA